MTRCEMVQALPGVFRLFSDEPQLMVRAAGRGRFILTGEVPHFRDPALRFESRVGDASVPLAEHSKPFDAFRALKRKLPRGVMARAREAEAGALEVALQEMTVPAAKAPFAQIFSTDLKQRVHRLDDNRFELLGATAGACLITLRVDTRRTLIAVPGATSAHGTCLLISDRVPAGYRAEVDDAIITLWKDADQRTLAA
jgi:hypothetical protein